MTTSRTGTREMLAGMGDRMGRQMDLAGELAEGFVDIAQRLMRGLAAEMPRSMPGKGCCDIPEPCWMPEDLGEIHCTICPGGRGQIRLTVTNTDFRRRDFQVAAAGPDAGRVQIAPATFQLGPKERRRVDVTLDTARDEDGAGKCETLEALIWVIGCRAHFLRWTVETSQRGGGCCHHVEVFDQPDYEHHWYDHFYCYRDCYGRAIRPDPKTKGREG